MLELFLKRLIYLGCENVSFKETKYKFSKMWIPLVKNWYEFSVWSEIVCKWTCEHIKVWGNVDMQWSFTTPLIMLSCDCSFQENKACVDDGPLNYFLITLCDNIGRWKNKCFEKAFRTKPKIVTRMQGKQGLLPFLLTPIPIPINKIWNLKSFG